MKQYQRACVCCRQSLKPQAESRLLVSFAAKHRLSQQGGCFSVSYFTLTLACLQPSFQRNFSFILASNHQTFSRDLVPRHRPVHTTMTYAEFFQLRREILLGLLRRIDEGDRDDLDNIEKEMTSHTRSASYPTYDLSCYVAVMSLCHANWLRAEVYVLMMSSVDLPLTYCLGRSSSHRSRLCVAACCCGYAQPECHPEHRRRTSWATAVACECKARGLCSEYQPVESDSEVSGREDTIP